MIYTLVFTIYSFLFTLLLLFSVLLKSKLNKVKSKLYILLILSGLLFALFEILTFGCFIYISKNPILFSINWKLRMSFILVYIELFIFYYDVLMNGEKYDSIFKTIIKSKKNLFVFIIFTFLIISYVVFGNYVIESESEIIFVDGFVGVFMLILALIVSFYLMFIAIKVRKTRRNVCNCFVLIFLLIIIMFPIQIFLSNISLMPLMMLYILYIVYHNIEDPDILLLEEVTILKNDIDNSNDSKTDFLFNLSYDLINPVNTINSLIKNINNMDAYNKNEIIDNYNNIISTSNLILQSVNDLVDFSLDNEKSNLKEYNIYELLSNLRTITISKIANKQISFDLNIDSNVNLKYYGELSKIKKVLSILLNNACKYTKVGKIRLDVSASCTSDFHTITFRVYDTGSGMSDEEVNNIFNGQELSLCKNLIESIGGTISVKSIFGGGSNFYVTINQKPRGNSKVVDELSLDNNNDKIVYRDLSNYKVLLVDDSDLISKVIIKLLSKYNFNVTSITSSIECLERIKSEEVFDFILINYKNKDIDGAEVVQLLKSLEGYNIPKIICLTASIFTGARDYYLSQGFDDYLSIPIDIYDLDRIINKYIKNE